MAKYSKNIIKPVCQSFLQGLEKQTVFCSLNSFPMMWFLPSEVVILLRLALQIPNMFQFVHFHKWLVLVNTVQFFTTCRLDTIYSVDQNVPCRRFSTCVGRWDFPHVSFVLEEANTCQQPSRDPSAVCNLSASCDPATRGIAFPQNIYTHTFTLKILYLVKITISFFLRLDLQKKMVVHKLA